MRIVDRAPSTASQASLAIRAATTYLIVSFALTLVDAPHTRTGGFHFEPSLAWPPLRGDGIEVEIDGKQVLLDDQIQMCGYEIALKTALMSSQVRFESIARAPSRFANQSGLAWRFVSALCGALVRLPRVASAHIAVQVAGSGELLRDGAVLQRLTVGDGSRLAQRSPTSLTKPPTPLAILPPPQLSPPTQNSASISSDTPSPPKSTFSSTMASPTSAPPSPSPRPPSTCIAP